MNKTREEILNMPAGREMDALVAKMVTHNNYVFNNEHPSYSTNIASAWEVVEKEEHGFSLWVSGVRSAPLCKAEIIIGDNRYGCYANTAPLAICRAALLAVLEDSS